MHGLSLTLDGYMQLVVIKKFLKPLVEKHCVRLGLKITAEEKKKILFYYPTYTVLACGQMYVSLKGRKLSKDETRRLTLVGAMATICDDLVDEEYWTREQVFSLLSDNAKEQDYSSLKARLLLSLNNALKSFWSLSPSYLHQLKLALEWQTKSQKQMAEDISLDEIVNICRQKNGNTSLMFSTLIDEDWDEHDKQFIYQSAIVGQLTNDSFDMYFDTQQGIHTYFNTASSIAQAKDFFLEECKALHDLIRATPTTEKNKISTIRRMSLLHGFTLTAIEQFQKTEDKYGRPVDWKSIPRKDLVIDMALNRNRFRTLHNIKWLSKI